ncbi:unnamed protein product, partial [Didymodactylos carnosus]
LNSINKTNMYGGGYGYPNNVYNAAVQEAATDNYINATVPGGVNSPMGQMMDQMMGPGNPNPTGQQMFNTATGGMGYNPYNPNQGYMP